MLFSIPFLVVFSSLCLITGKIENKEKNEEMVMSTKAETVTINSSQVRISTQIEKSHVYVQNNSFKSNFKECLKNHAASIGGYSIDGCCEFLPGGNEGTAEFLKCAACSCHRNFHRKETVVVSEDVIPFSFNKSSHPPAPAPAPAPTPYTAYSRRGGEENVHVFEHIAQGGGEGSSNSKKRFRTKFTTEQKEKMMDFATTLGWKIQKKDGNIVEDFCKQIGLQRHVFNVWIHNNKYTLGKMP
jgi:ZF-HD class homeobox domain-containing protein